MRIPRPARAKGKIKLDETAPPAAQAADNRVVSIEPPKQNIVPRLIKAIIGLIMLVVVVGAALYVIAVATIVAFPSVAGQTVYVARGEYPIAQYPSGSLVVAQPGDVDRSLMGKVDDLFGIPSAGIVEIKTGPYGELSNNAEGEILLDGSPIGVTGRVQTQVLDGAYLVRCVSGTCGAPGSLLFIPMDWIVGGARGYISTEGITPIPLPEETISDESLMIADR